MQFERSPIFNKDFKKLNKELQYKVIERLQIFIVNEFHPLLNNHKLKFDYEGFRSMNVTGDFRIIFRKIDSKLVLLYRVDTHSQLYGN